jgi:hypothetical protein
MSQPINRLPQELINQIVNLATPAENRLGSSRHSYALRSLGAVNSSFRQATLEAGAHDLRPPPRAPVIQDEGGNPRRNPRRNPLRITQLRHTLEFDSLRDMHDYFRIGPGRIQPGGTDLIGQVRLIVVFYQNDPNAFWQQRRPLSLAHNTFEVLSQHIHRMPHLHSFRLNIPYSAANWAPRGQPPRPLDMSSPGMFHLVRTLRRARITHLDIRPNRGAPPIIQAAFRRALRRATEHPFVIINRQWLLRNLGNIVNHPQRACPRTMTLVDSVIETLRRKHQP